VATNSTLDLFTELRRQLDDSIGARQEIMDQIYALVGDHLEHLGTGQLAELGSRCDAEVDRRLDAEQELFETGGEAAAVDN
jgi:hypothetical protein